MNLIENGERPIFNTHSERVELTPEQRELGEASHDLFMRLYHPPTMMLRRSRGEDSLIINPFDPSRRRLITAADIRAEHPSEELSLAINGFKRTEDLIPYYLEKAIKETVYIRGLGEFYEMVWGPEETGHGLSLGFIQVCSGFRTPSSVNREYYDTISYTWEAPYPTVPLMLNYVARQEGVTQDNYEGLENRAREEGVYTIADILAEIKKQEGGHFGWFLAWIDLFSQFYPNEMPNAAVDASKDFRMPGLKSIPWVEKRAMARLSGFNAEVAANVAERVLRATRGLTEEQIRNAVDSYRSKNPRLAGI